MKGASEARILTLQIHEALVKARVPGYLQAYASRGENPLSQLAEVKSKMGQMVDAGIQALNENCARGASPDGLVVVELSRPSLV
jgi:hypothetical protein